MSRCELCAAKEGRRTKARGSGRGRQEKKESCHASGHGACAWQEERKAREEKKKEVKSQESWTECILDFSREGEEGCWVDYDEGLLP